MPHCAPTVPIIPATVPRIEYMRIKNYRALRDLHIKDMTPLTVFLGPNGSGKSTIIDLFLFLSECFTTGLRKAWDARGRFRELRTRGENGPITIEIRYREHRDAPLITYHIAIDENKKGPYIAEEWLQWRRGRSGKPWKFLDFNEGSGRVIPGEMPEEGDAGTLETLDSAERLAASTLGQLAKHPRIGALRQFITDWHLAYMNADSARGIPDAGAQERLSPEGDNLPNVIQYLKEHHPERLDRIMQALSARVPCVQEVNTELLTDGRLLLQIKDAPFDRPIPAKFASRGTLKLLQYLTLLYDPDPPHLIGIEEPENDLHPRLLAGLAEEFRDASSRSQIIVTTHSPFFINGLRPSELWVLYRDEEGFTQAQCAVHMQGIPAFIESGALLGHLWSEGYFEVGNPLTDAGGSKIAKTTPSSPVQG